jgi:hypothetical protein
MAQSMYSSHAKSRKRVLRLATSEAKWIILIMDGKVQIPQLILIIEW